MRVSLFVVSVTFRNDQGDLLLVRKRGPTAFMLPGGKVEPGETHPQASVREVAEELSLSLAESDLTLLGHWSAGAANEPGLTITSDVFLAPLPGEPVASAEIEELRWLPLTPDAASALSPMLVEHVIPALLRRPTNSGGS